MALYLSLVAHARVEGAAGVWVIFDSGSVVIPNDAMFNNMWHVSFFFKGSRYKKPTTEKTLVFQEAVFIMYFI